MLTAKHHCYSYRKHGGQKYTIAPRHFGDHDDSRQGRVGRYGKDRHHADHHKHGNGYIDVRGNHLRKMPEQGALEPTDNHRWAKGPAGCPRAGNQRHGQNDTDYT